MSRESDIYDLSKEKIITVIYQYDYDETDDKGNVTPVSERHVVNIHLTFKSGVPTVEDITPPDMILPGDFVTLREPNVTPGAYEITGGGWELFATSRDAESHTNGVDYDPTFNPLYWYQDDYYVAYYAKSYLGRTYSNAVPVSVANYHDLADVMSDANKSHHMYIDHKNVKWEPKIYINDYSKSGKNGLDLFKNLYDLSLLTNSSVGVSDGVVTTVGPLKDHAIMNGNTHAGRNLEFFMRSDINHSEPWTSIGSESSCFEGTFHGDGHTISGLDHSLFNHLCGDVYNLGVTGSFTGGGIAETGGGYVENCWINTTGTPDGSGRAVFANPSAGADTKQIVNSYYQTGKSYSTTDTDNHGLAIAKPDMAFYNGEVAYDLNNFYLYKRYCDKEVTSGTANQRYNYYTIGDDDKLTLHSDKYYASNADLCSSGSGNPVAKYVEGRFEDGDFRFAAGEIPADEDERHWVEVIKKDGMPDQEVDHWSPIWPDDYIFFGQKLTYGYNSHAHQSVPTAVVRADGRLSQNSDANRVYRAPAYFQDKNMSVYHFNPTAYLAHKSKDGSKEPYPPMTAIDFAGHYNTNEVTGAYEKSVSGGVFYPPLLDDDGLISISNCDETQNLLVYAPAASGKSGYINAQTHGVLTSYFVDADFNRYYDNRDGYRLVEESDKVINGHLVQSSLIAENDHMLVDMQDFNCPIEYRFDKDHLMWYQRKPTDNEYVDRTMGWQGISLPFTAELVTTHEKGEITHFYSGSENSANDASGKKKIGHEYWLRELKNESEMTLDGKVLTATFNYPTAAGEDKEYTNTYLWDYYYKNESKHNQKDRNADTYLEYQQYYKTSHTHKNYPFLTAAKPYILGLPGSTYYEFDLSGKFRAENTAVTIPQLGKQTITFASAKGETIGVSDDEMTGVKATNGGNDYFFKPNYMNKTLAADVNYVMNSDGNAYVQLSSVTECYMTTGSKYASAAAFAAAGTLYSDEDGTVVADSWADGETTYYKRTSETPLTKNAKNKTTTSLTAFRPYFFVQASAGVKGMLPSSVVFNSSTGDEFNQGPESALDGSIEIFSRGRIIVVKSHMHEPTTIRINNINGINIKNFVLEPGQTVETPVNALGVYIINNKKVFIK